MRRFSIPAACAPAVVAAIEAAVAGCADIGGGRVLIVVAPEMSAETRALIEARLCAPKLKVAV